MGCISPVPKIPSPETKKSVKIKYTPGKPIKQHYVKSFISQKKDIRTLDLSRISFKIDDYDAKHIFRMGSTFYSVVQHKKTAKHTYILKEIDIFRRSQHELDTLKNELRVQALCNHKNIVKLYGFKEENHKYNVLQEYLEENLEKFCSERKKKNEPLLDQEILKIYSAILSALNYLHREFNFSPQDLNPSHVLVTKDLSKIKINIAGSLHIYEKPSADSSIFFSGNDRFMAPELRKKFQEYKPLKINDSSIPKFPFDEVDLKECDGYSLGLIIIYISSMGNLSKSVVESYIDQMSVDFDSHEAILKDLKDFIPQKIQSQVLSLLNYQREQRGKILDLYRERKS